MRPIPDDRIENLLKSAPPKGAPGGLRERVIGAARRRAADSATTPLLRSCLAGCAVILLIVFSADALVTKIESGRLMAALGTPISSPEVSGSAEEIVDPLLDQLRADRLILLADGKGGRRTHRDLRKMEKQFLLEEYDGD